MKISEVKHQLQKLETIGFILPDGSAVPAHFHVTEVGEVTKHFIDCGGTVRFEKTVNFQLWEADDYDHRLHPEKLSSIIELSQSKLGFGDHKVEVEYQGATIGTYTLDFDGKHFLLKNKFTDCLAKDACGVPQEKMKFNLKDLTAGTNANTCTPGGDCC